MPLSLTIPERSLSIMLILTCLEFAAPILFGLWRSGKWPDSRVAGGFTQLTLGMKDVSVTDNTGPAGGLPATY
jgi:hypothetical protein